MKDFHNKVAVITGAGGGVGSALAQQLAARGCHLALVDISEPALVKVADALAGSHIKVSRHVVDITSKTQMADLPDAAVRTLLTTKPKDSDTGENKVSKGLA